MTIPFEAGPSAELNQGIAILTAATQVRLPYLVFASVASANQDTGVPHFESKHHIEQRLTVSTLGHTVVAPTYFFDNVLGDPSIARGTMPLALPGDRPLQQLDRGDLGRFVAYLLANPAPHLGARIELAGDDPTPNQMAAAIEAASGHPVRHQPVPLDEVHLRSPNLAAMFAFLTNSGYQVDLPVLHDRYPQMDWTSFADWTSTQNWPQPD
ncbi:MAG: NmrA family NAD(P)-binding protein [Pseudonocardiaceae bacterium]